jgi:hypothetical protein
MTLWASIMVDWSATTLTAFNYRLNYATGLLVRFKTRF